MEHLTRALREETGMALHRNVAKKCFNKVYSFLLYHDTVSLFEALDYRMKLKQEQRTRERYYVFRHMLQLVRARHPRKFRTLCL